MYECSFGKDRYHQQRDMVNWCHDNIGDGGWLGNNESDWSVDSIFGETTFKFKIESDLTLFLLRWM